MDESSARARSGLDYLRQRGREGAGERPSASLRRPEPPSVSPDRRFPGWVHESEFVYRRRQTFPGLVVPSWPSRISPEAVSPGGLLFFDTETTGLSGGAGTMIFLFGVGWSEGPDFVVEQLFLSDFPGEPEFLLGIKQLLPSDRALVSYNGRSFDAHLLRSRFLMNRIDEESWLHVDLLYHARRLWKSVSSDCSLRGIESAILGVDRGDDVPGMEIPGIWYDFLRTGRPDRLSLVFDHNVTDITSLARIYGTLGRLLGGELAAAPVDQGALGRWLLGPDPESGIAILQKAYEDGDSRAGLSLGLHFKREGRWEEALRVWQSAVERSHSLLASVELAKHLEHRARRPDLALQVIERLLGWGLPLGKQDRTAIAHRLQRLRRKVEGRTASPAEGPEEPS
ncbi:MAG TPA: ribonuclease H-like domain-containing protein [Spirochaetia bacterium]|nr:ribonuclease H-like domain-containing protein [Spirochaetia bacterium]